MFILMSIWINGKFNEKSLPEKENFHCLNMEDITVAGYMQAKRVCKDFEIKNLGEYHDFYLKNDQYSQLMFLKTLEKYV